MGNAGHIDGTGPRSAMARAIEVDGVIWRLSTTVPAAYAGIAAVITSPSMFVYAAFASSLYLPPLIVSSNGPV